MNGDIPEIYKKASVFGMSGVEVDGMDVLAVRALLSGGAPVLSEGPTLIGSPHLPFPGPLWLIQMNCAKAEKEFLLVHDSIKILLLI